MLTKDEYTNIGIDRKLVVIPCIMQIAAKQNDVLNRVNFGLSPNVFNGCRIRDKTRVTFSDPLDIEC
jgi:hypothetical protein